MGEFRAGLSSLQAAGVGSSSLQTPDPSHHGNALVARLLYDINHTGLDLRYETGWKELIRLGDEIVRAVLFAPSGELTVRARKGVVLTTGGIGWSRELRDQRIDNPRS